MPQHPPYYGERVRRRATHDPPLSPAERQELDLHLRICPRCGYDLAERLRPRDPDAAQALLETQAAALTAERVTPYLRELARTKRAGMPLTPFQGWLWPFVLGDREARGRYRLVEAEVWLCPRG